MAEVAALELQIGANVDQAVSGMKQFEKSLFQLQNELKTFKAAQETTLDPKQYITYGQKITAVTKQIEGRMALMERATQEAAGAVKGIGSPIARTSQQMIGMTKSSSSATNSLFALSGVVQDAPFGFRAIANNIQFFSQQMAYTAKTSGGFKAALKAMGGAFLGPAGIIFAISAATTLLTYFFDSEGKASKETDALTDKINDLKSGLKGVADIQGDTIRSTAAQTAKLKVLYAAATDVTRSQAERLSAAKKLQDAFPQTFGNLTKINIISGKAAGAFQTLSDNILKVAKASVILKDVEANIQKIGDAQKEVDKAIDPAKFKKLTDNYIAAQKTLENAGKLSKASSLGGQGGFGGIAVAQKNFDAARDALNAYTKSINSYRGVIQGAKNDNDSLIKSFNALDLKEKPKPGGTGSGKTKGESLDILQRRATFHVNNALQATNRAMQDFGHNAGQSINSTLIPALGEVTKRVKDIQAVTTVVNEGTFLTENWATAAGALNDAFAATFSTIAGGGNVFQSITKAVEGLIIKLAAATAAAAVLTILTGGSFTAAATVAGSFKNILGSLSGLKFADGGIVHGPTRALIGEYAGARTNPEVVAPLSKLKDILSNSGRNLNVTVGGEFRMSGSTLVAAVDRERRSQDRRG